MIDPTLRHTPCGAVTGTVAAPGVTAYKGIRYATAGRWQYPEGENRMEKIDFHTHAAPTVQPMRPNPWNPRDCYVADLAELRQTLQAQGITHAVLMSGGEVSRPGVMCASNEVCKAMAETQNGFFDWACNFEPEHPETVYERMRRCKEAGAVAVGELMVNQWLDSEFLTSVFDAAERLELPVTLHMSPEPGFAYGVCDRPGLPLLEQVLQQHPGLTILGHSQLFWLEISGDCPTEGNEARSAMGKGPVTPGGRVPELFERYPNLYGDLSAFSGSCAIVRDPAFGVAFLERYADRLLFATDTYNKHQRFPLGQFLDDACAQGKLSRAAYEKIYYKNAQRLLRRNT